MGSANRLLSKLTKLNFTGFVIDSAPKNSIVTGNPIRDSFNSNYKNFIDSNDIINIYVTGGSQGADYINQNVPKCFNSLNKKINIKHQCGSGKIDAVREAYENAKVKAEVKETLIGKYPDKKTANKMVGEFKKGAYTSKFNFEIKKENRR